jgi:MFS transporter, ACS family, hexuronate transporter
LTDAGNNPVSARPVPPGANLLPRLRWVMIGLIFLITLINFINRLTISVLAPEITKKLSLTNLQYSYLATFFLAAYALSQALSGRLYDRIGNRRGFSLSVIVFSIAAMLHAAARSFVALSAFRFILGLGEAGNWPGAAKVVGEWFPPKERALALGIFNSGAALGSVIAPPLIIFLDLRYGWESTFLVIGALGFLWLIPWLLIYHPAATDPRLTAENRLALKGGAAAATAARQPKRSVSELLAMPRTWGILLSRLFTDPTWWLFINWLPLYLFNVRGLDLKHIAAFAWLPFLAADIGSLSGGWASGHLIARGWSLESARKTVLAISALLMSLGLFAAGVKSTGAALVLISAVLFGFQAWINNVQVLPSDLYAEENVATIAGLGGLAAGIGAIIFTLSTGWLVDHFSYTPVLVISGILPLIGTGFLFLLTKHFEPCKSTPN